MRIKVLRIANYKSLRSISFAPQALTVIAGPNGSGKSNLTDCLDFLSIMYRYGLEVAVASKGGYENIAHRKMRRTKRPIEFSIQVELARSDFGKLIAPRAENTLTVLHTFSFLARGASIRAEYAVENEALNVLHKVGMRETLLLSVARVDDKIVVQHITERDPKSPRMEERYRDVQDVALFAQRSEGVLSRSELFITALARFAPSLSAFTRKMGEIKVFQIHPNVSRDDGVPGPRPELNKHGGNLPAVIDSLSKNSPRIWSEIVTLMRSIVPKLLSIDVYYTPSRRLGLTFHESDVGKPWTVDEVSDGTIQSLALLVAMFDPVSSAVIVEEPENSVHPWIVRVLINACRQVSQQKQVIITTHSPVVLNEVSPSEIMIIWRAGGQSLLASLSDLDPTFVEVWAKGDRSTFGFLDSGVLRVAVPPEPQLMLDLEQGD